MKFLILMLLMTLVGCSVKCDKFQYRDYRYKDKVTVIVGFYKGQTGVIQNRSKFYEWVKEDWKMDQMCRYPSFEVKLDNGEEIDISQTKLFVDDDQHVVIKLKKTEEVKPKEEEKTSTCIEKLGKEIKNCDKTDLKCRYKFVIKLARCRGYN